MEEVALTLNRLILMSWALIAFSACSQANDDDSAESNDCSEEDVFNAVACDEEYCGPPVVRLGTGANSYEPISDGEPLPIVFGAQGGYHIDVAVEMDRLCPIVFLRPSAWIIGEDGEATSFFDQNRHVQAVRIEPFESPLQQFWGIRAFVPCEHWPNDPDRDLECAAGAGSLGPLEQFEVELRIEVEDHNGRIGSDIKRIQPTCCEG